MNHVVCRDRNGCILLLVLILLVFKVHGRRLLHSFLLLPAPRGCLCAVGIRCRPDVFPAAPETSLGLTNFAAILPIAIVFYNTCYIILLTG